MTSSHVKIKASERKSKKSKIAEKMDIFWDSPEKTSRDVKNKSQDWSSSVEKKTTLSFF